jgi:hypothetical protein
MSESLRMDPADVPDELVDDAVDAWHEMPRPMALDDQMRHILAAVLPEFERQVREKVAEEIEKSGGTGSGCLWNAATLAAAEIARGGAS